MTRPVLQAKKVVGVPGTTSTTSIGLTSGWAIGAGGASYVPVQNDLVIVTYSVASTSDVAIGVTTTGYTEEQETYSNDTNDANLSVSWKKMGSTQDTSVDVSSTDNAQFVSRRPRRNEHDDAIALSRWHVSKPKPALARQSADQARTGRLGRSFPKRNSLGSQTSRRSIAAWLACQSDIPRSTRRARHWYS